MPNPFFRFKQFTVYHDRCAMKVGTDGVLLGAWTNPENATNVLDVGTGPGLIALMLAQKDKRLQIDAIDIDMAALAQCRENVERSPFLDQIQCINQSLQEYCLNCNKMYDLIVSNPPYFEQSLKSPLHNRSVARHTDSLSAAELLQLSSELLTDNGRLSVIYPFEYKEYLLEQQIMHAVRITNVYPTPASTPKRVLVEFSKTKSGLTESNLTIEEERHEYSAQFTELVKDYYLKL